MPGEVAKKELTPAQMESIEYLKKHRLTSFIDEMVIHLTTNQPGDPYLKIIEAAHQMRLAQEEEKQQMADKEDPLLSSSSPRHLDGSQKLSLMRMAECASSGKVPPLNILILIVGSRGDVQPFVALGKELRKYGHKVRLATHVVFRKFVTEHGLEFFPLRGDPAQLMSFIVENPDMITFKPQEVEENRRTMRSIYESTWAAATSPLPGQDEYHPDIVIANPVGHSHLHVCEALGIPLHIMFTMPWSPNHAYPHPFAPFGPGKLYSNYRSYSVVDKMVWLGLGGEINRLRTETLKLNKISNGVGLIEAAQVPQTYCMSRHLASKPSSWDARHDVVGFWFLDTQDGFQPEKKVPRLLEFLKSGPPPVYIGFGSIVVADPQKLSKTVVDGATASGQRVVIHQGWARLGEGMVVDSRKIFLLDDPIPHDWLFPKCSAVCHHGGAGTTATGLRAGTPTIVVPFFGDQPFWGGLVAHEGVGPEPTNNKKLTPEKLAEAIKFCMTTECQEKAKAMGEKIREEKGVENGVAAFHKKLPMQDGRWVVSCWENQRWYPTGWSNKLLSNDPRPFSDISGNHKVDMEAARLPKNWEWEEPWARTKEEGRTDGEGWMYATHFNSSEWSAEATTTQVVRQRQWFRWRKYKWDEAEQPTTVPPVEPGVSGLHQCYVQLKEGKGLAAKDVFSKKSDPFVTMYVERGPKKFQVQSSKVVNKSLDPEWNQQFCFNLEPGDSLHFEVMDYDVVGSNDEIGVATLTVAQIEEGVGKASDGNWSVSLDLTPKDSGSITMAISF